MKFTKAQLMEIILRQQESINIQAELLSLIKEKLRLLEEQNQLLWKYYDKLEEETKS